ncbi:biopolymer transporter ExbD [Fulvivirgaceae bacterium BMA10]|uniref:Biopolymer transporter ExbD n=1 Tax=Splendidivirga corallicola TaxID=3051826 RepID=A0ABT8KQB9_9BACT|nr:biopolymer transporter ExbD [Fulvivirgaceae bacterium BMA10]
MSKFKKKSKSSQEIPTAALPDIIFMLLFFFMISTVIRQDEQLVEQKLPQATQLKKIEKKSLVSYLYIGKPKNIASFGSEPKIQANDNFIEPNDIVQFVLTEKDKLDESQRDQIIISMKVDRDTKMGIVTDVQEELKEANARKLLYNTPLKAVQQ